MIQAGVYTALVSPFLEHSIDVDALHKLLERQVMAGITGVIVGGSTGESVTCTKDELSVLLRTAKSYDLCVIAGVSSASTKSAVESACFAEDCGVDALLVCTPYYNRPTQEGLYEHFLHVGNATALPFLLYNVPSRTATTLERETVVRIYNAVSNCKGLKEATSDMLLFSRLRKACGEDFLLFSGDDATFLPSLSVGSNGVISVASNVVPDLMQKLFMLWERGAILDARKLHEHLIPLFDALCVVTNPMPVKAMLASMGLCQNRVRLPLKPYDGEYTQLLSAYL